MPFDLLNYVDANANWCISGGADGADLAWGDAARHQGHGVCHLSFHGHHTAALEQELVRIDDVSLNLADVHCARANAMLGRRYPPRSLKVRRLLQRNWYQVQHAQSVYAVSSFDKDGIVEGGTSWAIAMYLQKHTEPDLPLYVFDQKNCHWFQWIGDVWEAIYEPPHPTGIWAGIGRRDLNFLGRLAINTLMDYRPREKIIW